MEKIVEKVIAVPKPYPVKEFIEKKVQKSINWEMKNQQKKAFNEHPFWNQNPKTTEK